MYVRNDIAEALDLQQQQQQSPANSAGEPPALRPHPTLGHAIFVMQPKP
jgi:hypothetical protein